MPDDIISLTDFKSDASGWIERLQNQPPVVLTQNGRGRAVVLSYDAFRAMQAEVALLTRLAHAQDDLKAGLAKPQAEVFAQARARLAKRLEKRPTRKPAAHGAA
jgi:prevent-host-death family protein